MASLRGLSIRRALLRCEAERLTKEMRKRKGNKEDREELRELGRQMRMVLDELVERDAAYYAWRKFPPLPRPTDA